ncbi:helix-turn-helix transcriptional regulator [Paenibacillus cisolokensis]|uniref:helix-turn-helix domain-containing protein n=1 Tax=Paenibacillus cisolokensis TaxID=1658519 RepID=UPI003D2DB3FB
MSLGLRIKNLRKDKGLTQRDLASKLEIDNTTVSKWEADVYEPDTATLNKLADLFEVTADYLLGRTNNPKGYQSNMSFYGGPDHYTQDEIEEMEAALERYRAMKRRAAEQAEKDLKE